MEKHQVNIRSKLFSCIIALSLVFGISAMPAFATPDSNASEGVSAQADGEQDTQSEPKVLTPAKTQAVSSGTEDSDWGADAKKKAAQDDAEQSELSGIEKAGAVLGAEGELIGTQATGNKIAAQEEMEEKSDPKDIAKSEIRAAILASYFGTYDEPGDAPLTIIKMFPNTSDATFLTKQGGDDDTAPYTVEYEIKGAYLDEDGCPIYKDKSNKWFCADPADVDSDNVANTKVKDLKHRALYYTEDSNPDENGDTKKLFSKDDKGIYDTDSDADPRKSLRLYPGKNVKDEQVLIAVNDDGNSYGYVYNGENNSVFYTGIDEYGSDRDAYISIKKVKCEKNDEDRIIGTVVENTFESSSSVVGGEADTADDKSNQPERFLFPEQCALEAGKDYYIGILDEVNDDGESQYILLDSKKLDLERCTVGNMPNGKLVRAEVDLDNSTITFSINSGMVKYPLPEDGPFELPYPAEYTITEKSDPSYTFVKAYFDGDEDKDLGNPAVIQLLSSKRPNGEGHTITFVNKLDPNSDSPNLSIVNEYTYDEDQNAVIVQKKKVAK